MRSLLILLLGLLAGALQAQYPFVRSFEVRSGQQRPHITSLVQGGRGMLWLATDIGLLRTDGELTERIMPSEGRRITALGARGQEVFVSWTDGCITRCRDGRCDTLLQDTTFNRYPVRAIERDAAGDLWVATYGAGVLVLHGQERTWITSARGLNDDHVNDLCLVDKAEVAVATDQGIAVCARHGVLRRIREQDGLPDNLVLSLGTGAGGRVWAGTDRGGVLTFDPGATRPRIKLLDSTWQHGPVNALLADREVIWAATAMNGVVACDVNAGLATYLPANAAADVGVRAMDLLRTFDGAVLWCDGSDRIFRADPDVLLVPQHEGRDLRHITALCSDPLGRIWFATADGVFRHGAAFADELRLDRIPLEAKANTPVSGLVAEADGTVWVGTMGSGVFRLGTNGEVVHIGEQEGLANDNVLAIRTRDGDVWFATLGGISVRRRDGRMWHPTIPGSGFVYDVLPMPDGSVLAATDGNGIVRVDAEGKARRVQGRQHVETFYSLTLDQEGRAWACGPGTGLCRVDADSLACLALGRPPFDGNVYGIVAANELIAVLGSNGVALFDPKGGGMADLGRTIGLAGIEAELNTIAVDPVGAIWLACDKGMVRIAPNIQGPGRQVPCVILGVEAGGETMPTEGPVDLRHDQNFVRFRFAGPYFASPGSVRFQYRLTGYDPTIHDTRDREVSFSRLPAGRYSFEVRALLDEEGLPGPWIAVPFRVRTPWYRTPWAILGLVVAAVSALSLLIRSREARIRYRDRVEKEKARFQLDALRSQVNPHFLFNSFNTLIELIEEDQSKAVEHVEQLSEFFRNILQVRDKDLIPLREELRLLDTYFYLEQRRFGERIALRTQVPEEQRELLLPPLTLQLLVENAIKHNAATMARPLVVEVSALDGYIEVSNPIQERKAAMPSTGFGVQSIRQRYAALTELPVSVTNDGVYFRVRIPLIPKP
ncbi:MAG: histidine kinase [Flavobacteriales bacterium]|nr:histidine kinase [Flavobacteriales bacterium]